MRHNNNLNILVTLRNINLQHALRPVDPPWSLVDS